jgi:hypothetical protein
MNRAEKIDSILEDLDSQAAQGWSSNWAEYDETPTALIVTMADGSRRRFNLPKE